LVTQGFGGTLRRRHERPWEHVDSQWRMIIDRSVHVMSEADYVSSMVLEVADPVKCPCKR
jgi:hypothetical protein